MPLKRKLLRIPRQLSIDSSIILAHFFGEELGEAAKASGILPARRRTNYCARTAISESYYILCRNEGKDYASEGIQSLLMSNYVTVLSSDEIDIEAGRYKCSRALSLADCYVLAVAKVKHIPAMFARREDDIKKELERQSFDVPALFLEDRIW